MGVSPAPPWATVFFGIHEIDIVPRWSLQIMFYKRFIDDVFAVWLCHPDPDENSRLFLAFQTDMNAWHGLEWEFTPLASSCNFMDLKVEIAGDKIKTSVYEKPMNLYLYIPPHSAHAKGISTGLVLGHVLRYQRLCSDPRDADRKILEFAERLVARGHSRRDINLLLARAEKNAAAFLARSKEEHQELKAIKEAKARRQVYYHVQYHPEDPPASAIQQLWQELVQNPPGEKPLTEMVNCLHEPVGVDRLVVAYSRPLNLRNQFSVRDIQGRGREVSTYMAE